jgi:DNA-binding MarR family transcriptional regulator
MVLFLPVPPRAESSSLLIKQIADAVGRLVNSELKRADLTFAQICLIMELGDAGGQLTLKELERRFKVAQPTIVGIVQRLEAKGLVAKSAGPEDCRVKVATLTPLGARCQVSHTQTVQAFEEHLVAPLNGAERLELVRLLRLVRDGICDEDDKEESPNDE